SRAGMKPEDESGGDAVVRYAELNESFHAGVVEMAKSTMLEWSLERIQTLPFVRPGATIIFPASPEILTLSVDHHHCILESIANREGARAEALAREHARLVRRNLEMVMKGTADLSSMPGASLLKIR